MLVLMMGTLSVITARADAFERVGPVYGVSEEDFAVYMKRRAYEAKADGSIEKARQKVLAKARKAFVDPDAIPGVSPASERKTYHVDPGMIIAEDVVDHENRTIAPAGTYVNALDHITLSHGFLFFNANDPRQKAMGKEIVDHYGKRKVKVILVGGGPAPLEKEWKMPIYYDQNGTLVRKLRIENTPAFVTQDDRRLRVDVLPVY